MLQKQNSPRKAGRKYLLIAPLLAALTVISVSSFTLKNKVSGMIRSLSPTAQQFNVKGVVTNQYGEPIAKVTVLVAGTQTGTITNMKGRFSLKNIPHNSRLIISMIGYSTISLDVNSEKTLHLTLYSDPEHLNQIVVTGYLSEAEAANLRDSSTRNKPIVVTGYPLNQSKRETERTKEHSFEFVEQMPSFPGGQQALGKYLQDNLKYPQEARKEGIQGTVIVSFVVDKDGNLSNIHTVGSKLGGGLEEEALRIIQNMPKWDPAHQNGEALSVPYTLPILFELK